MKLIKPSYNIIEQQPGLIGIYKQIEKAGRVCYKSEDKITEDSAEAFVQKMVDSKHYAMLEHGTVYLHIQHTSPLHDKNYLKAMDAVHRYSLNKYSKVVKQTDNYYLINHYIITNFRVIIENGWDDDMKYLCEPTEHHEKRYTVHFTADAGVMREFFRHRVFSLAQESTRYCNYSKGKFDSELTFIIPPWCNIPDNPSLKDIMELEEMIPLNSFENRFFYSCLSSEQAYLELISLGYKPQQARVVLPLSIKAEGIMTGFASDWRHFFSLRTSIIAETGKPHPQASELADPLYKEFINRGYMEPLI